MVNKKGKHELFKCLRVLDDTDEVTIAYFKGR